MMKKIIVFGQGRTLRAISLVLMVALLVVTTGCSTNQAKEPPENVVEPHIIVDMGGTKVELPDQINRVVCIQPTLTEYMIAFGVGDKLVGTHKNALNKVWLQKVYPEISSLKAYSYSASAEDVLASEVDLVIVPNNEAAEQLRAAGIPTVVIMLNDPDSEYQHIKMLGEIFGQEVTDRINTWIDEVENVKDEINAVLDEANITEGPNVYAVNGQSDNGIFYPQGGGGSALETYLNGIRATFALKDFPANGNMPTEEEILATDPEVILIGGKYGVPLKEAVLQDSVWADISAIKNERVYNVPIGGIGWDQGYIALPVELKFWANIFYPDVFQYDLTADIIEFYQEYFGVTLTSEDIAYMINGLTPEGTPAWED